MAKVDLNLFVIFDAIMQEQSITAASERLSMTQPSVSNAVSRMRHSWKDPLFIKHGRGIKPTPYAKQLWRQISTPLTTISHSVSPPIFHPEKSTRRFRISLTDGMTSIIWLPLRKIIEAQAPGIDILAVPCKADGEQLLLDAEVDLVFDYYPGTNRQIRTQKMFDNHFVCVMRPDHELADKTLTLNRYIQADHLLVSLSGDARGITDSILNDRGKNRRVALTVNSFAAARNLLQETNLITSLPYPVVAPEVINEDLIAKALPINIPPATITMAWHCRQDHDAGLTWLRETLSTIVESKRVLLDTVMS